ncbi:hypothetical protein TspCOW1_28270 [Thiohalobacter sp. COW1]|uniref:HD-GYP domain-containing protein n=1 Tax=Thiohalobacter sp. COW1 TaxID=2795687 RepID=UPI0019154B7F|nr:HD domain-containing phosphohydrolase [Thiohalobacter sp. COW1]BCO32724.1 hypothetical protein TspCOW1_28270 [Thiohalobacter sp. COW1]
MDQGHSRPRLHGLIGRIAPDLSALWCPQLSAAGAMSTSFRFQDPGGPVLEQLDAVHANLRATLLSAHAGQHIDDRVEMLADAVEDAVKLNADTALAYLFIRNGEGYPLLHAIHCAVVVCLGAQAAGLGTDERHPLLCAALTQNISMCALQAELFHLHGPPASLDRLLIRRHPLTSVGILKALGVTDPDWLEAVALHHERFDGSGYPFSLRGAALPFGARLIGAADIYCAAVSPRGYRHGRPAHEAMRNLFMGAGRVVDDALARLLVKTLGIYPPGSLIELRNRELALVVARGDRVDRPWIKRLKVSEAPQLVPAEGEHCAVRVLSTGQWPEGLRLERTWREAEALQQGLTVGP